MLDLFSSGRRHPRIEVVTGVQTCALPVSLGLCVLAPVLLTRGAPAPLRLFSYLAGVAGAGIAVWAMAVFQLDPVEIALDALGKERTLTGRSIPWEYELTPIEMPPWLRNGFDSFWNGGIASQWSVSTTATPQAVKNYHTCYMNNTA